MDYAIYKTNDGKFPRIIYRFRQCDFNHQAKRAAKAKLHEMWLKVIRMGIYPSAEACGIDGYNETEFSYDHPTSTSTKERIRFYIAKL